MIKINRTSNELFKDEVRLGKSLDLMKKLVLNIHSQDRFSYEYPVKFHLIKLKFYKKLTLYTSIKVRIYTIKFASLCCLLPIKTVGVMGTVNI